MGARSFLFQVEVRMSGSDKPVKSRMKWLGRKATQRKFPIGDRMCQNCGKAKATQRHHKDGNENNMAASNIEYVCQACMAKLDKNRWGWKGKGN